MRVNEMHMPVGSIRGRVGPSALMALAALACAGSPAQDIVATPEQRQAIESQMAFFRAESDAIRAAAGAPRSPDAEDCMLKAGVATTTYVCPAAPASRDRIKAALLARQWTPTTLPTRDPWYALDAFGKGATRAFFVCAPGRPSCLLELQQAN